MNEYCLIATVGESSLHREWLKKDAKFDMHLIVYDHSYTTFREDTPYVTAASGFKFRLLDKYLNDHGLIDRYKYFYLPDDDILIDPDNIEKLFWYMETYDLAIAQPAISNYYVSYAHMLRRPNSTIRSTNLVEIMQPFMSREALRKVQFTFRASKSGWGIDYHWSKITGLHKMKMAIIDDIVSIHTRPVRSSHDEELLAYFKRYSLGAMPVV